MSAAEDLALALRLADAADRISMDRYQSADLRVEAKPDLTPVTDADTAVERELRAMIARARPDDRVEGEEFGGADPGAGRRWIIDPIDGTKNFVRGVPVWGTLIALLDGPAPVAEAAEPFAVAEPAVLGVVSAPALARRWWAHRGGGAFASFQGGPARRCQVSGVRELADASLSISDLVEWEKKGRLGPLLDLTRACWRLRGYGDFYSYMLLAEGAVDIAAEPDLNLWDVAALVSIVTEAGGRITGIDGSAPATDAGSALATNGLLHAAAAEVLQAD